MLAHRLPEIGELKDDQEERSLNLEMPAPLSGHELQGHAALTETRELAMFIVAPSFGVLMLCLVVDTSFHKMSVVRMIPSSVWIILCSSLLGIVARHLMDQGALHEEHITFGLAGILNLVLLPIIIFASGWTLNHRYFFQQLEYILLFAVVGSLITFFLIATVMAWLAKNQYTLVDDLRSNLVFSALISAIDPVATLSTFSTLGIDATQPLLHNMVFGESVVNDAVAISLFNAVNDIPLEEMGPGIVVKKICTLLVFSCLLGFVFSCLLVLLFRLAVNQHHFASEVIFIGSAAWFIYASAEACHLSGIIANLVAGSVFKIYGSPHLSHEGRTPAECTLAVGSEMCDTMVFMICGICCGMLTPGRGLPFIMFAIVACVVARAVSVSLCAAMSNGIKKFYGSTSYITPRHQVMMWHAGLRGGIALVLALEIDGEWCKYKATIINATFAVICFTLLVFGSTTKLMLDLLNFEYPDPDKPRRHSVPELPHGASMADQHLFRNRVYQAVHQALAKVLVGEEKANEVMGVSKDSSGLLSPVSRVLTTEK